MYIFNHIMICAGGSQDKTVVMSSRTATVWVSLHWMWQSRLLQIYLLYMSE